MKNFTVTTIARHGFPAGLLLFLLCTAPFFIPLEAQENKKDPLDRNWEFEYAGSWHPAKIPGCIHTDLLRNGWIEDPFYRSQEDSSQWIARRDWTYLTTFSWEEILLHQHAEIVFEGLDGYAELYLNGVPFLHRQGSHITDNMFRRWVFPLDGIPLQESNELVVFFHPTTRRDSVNALLSPYPLPDIRALTRKSPYQSGWDWGPRLVTCGIWKPVYLNTWNDFTLDDLQIYQRSLTDTAAILRVELSLSVFQEDTFQVEIRIDGSHPLRSLREMRLATGKHTLSYEYEIKDPKRWHPNGLGAQDMYTVTASVSGPADRDEISRRIGLRTVELVRKKEISGSSFAFHVNGKPVFMKGANWIPAESFPSSVTEERYRALVKAMADAGMNMARVWGGGIYESDLFYDLCNEMGILVWQDFIFAGALYPEGEAFRDNVRQEAAEQVKRLRNHPSLALWCGNNEVKNAWEDWGWQAGYDAGERERISQNIETLFNKLLPSVVEENDPGRPYIPTSPLWGWGHPESLTEGNAHYWGVWWGEQPFEVWEEKTGRFMAEYGFQSYPSLASICRFTLPADREVSSPVMASHQKHARGVEIITQAIHRYFGDFQDFEEFIYLSQLVQAYGVGNAIETHRRKMPYCMGSLYWQLNDCWPVASWSSIDYYLEKKALYYAAKRLFAPVIIATAPWENNTLPIHIVSDGPEDFSGELTVNLFDFSGNLLQSYPLGKHLVRGNHSTQVALFELSPEYALQKDRIFLTIHFDSPKVPIARKIVYLEYPKNLALPKGNVHFKVLEKGGGYHITATCDTLAKGVYFHTTQGEKGDYSDNYFDLLPGQEKTIRFTPALPGRAPVFEVKWYND